MPRPSNALQDTLAPHADGLRRLVRGLVYSDAEAEDVVQDTLLAAVQQEQAPANWRAWLTRVARNQASNLRRTEGRRSRRERAAARPESQPAADEMVARLDEKQRLLDCLRRLEEPYRETLILRYFEDLPPRTIALRREVPVNTVKTHLQRGLVRLRAQLDEAHDGRRERWRMVLIPLAGVPGDRSLLTTALGWTAMKKITVGIVSAALLIAVGWSAKELLWSDDAAPDEHAASDTDARTADPTRGGDASSPRLAGRDEEALLPPPPSPDPAPATKENSIHGRVVGLDGRPIRGVVVTARSAVQADLRAPLDLGTMRSESDVDGTYLAGPLLGGQVTVEARGKGLVAVTRTVPARGARADFVMEPAFEIALVVTDARGQRVAGAQVVYTARVDNFTRTHKVSGATDAEGTIRIVGVLDEPGRIEVRSNRHGLLNTAVRKAMFARAGSQTWTTITLPDRVAVEGLVVDGQTGAPIAGAVVTVGWGRPRERLQTDATGRFETRAARRAPRRLPVRVYALGYRAAHASLEVPDAKPATIRIELEPAAPLRGIVRTAAGAPVAGAVVRVTSRQIHHDLETRSDAEGRFALAMPGHARPRISGSMPEALRARLLAKYRLPLAAGHPEHGHGVVGVALSDLEKQIEIRLSGVGEVTGTVRTADGEPAVGAVVRLVPQWKESRPVETEADRLQSHLWSSQLLAGHPSLSAVANTRGAFRVRGVPAASYRAEARLGDDRVAVERDVRVAHGATRRIALALGEELTIRGRIVDQQGSPVRGAVILPLLGEMDVLPATHSRSDGSFIIRGLTAGTYRLMLEAPSMHFAEQPMITAGAEDVVIRVERSIPFKVLVTHGGRPYAKRFTVAVLDRHPPTRATEGMVEVGPPFRLKKEAWGPKGECTVSGLPPGEYRIRIRTKEGLQSEEDALITLVAGVTPAELRFDIRKP